MRLIAVSSATQTEWGLVEDNQLIQNAFTDSLNPSYQTRREISRCVRLGLPETFFRKKLPCVHFYGKGCLSREKRSIIEASLVAQFRTPVQVESYLLGVARSLFQSKAGIACILDIDSESCLYNGSRIVTNVHPGGYILGDEGSGAALGRVFLSDVLKGLAPSHLISDFYEKFRINAEGVMESVYNHPCPNRFLATIPYFLDDYMKEDYVLNLIRDNLRSFFVRHICQYDYRNYPVRFIGTQACHYAEFLQETAREFGIEPDTIAKTPMEGLVNFHSINDTD
jgi:N-acetylglucosamine kinase-like BadF-type ATPase